MLIGSRPRILALAAALALVALAGTALVGQAPGHTLIVLSHNNHTAYEVNMTNGRILHEFIAPDQAHEAAISADGMTIYASVPAAALVEIIDARTFKEKGKI